MRNFLILFLLLQCSPFNAQTPYHPMLVEGRVWDIFEVPVEQSICSFESAGQYFLKGDTLINGVIYKKLYSQVIRSNPPFPFCGGFYLDTTAAYLSNSFFREDTLTRKVYEWNSNENPPERLLYDFSLQAGDTLHYQFESFPILSVTDWILANGEHRKAFEIGNWVENYYVEEIGYLKGQFGQVFAPFEAWRKTTCVRDAAEILYSDASNGGSGCVLALSSTITPDFQAFKISPNPFSDHINLRISEGFTKPIFVFELYDLTGRAVFRREIEQKSSVISVDLPALPQGIYGWAVDGFLHGKLVKI